MQKIKEFCLLEVTLWYVFNNKKKQYENNKVSVLTYGRPSRCSQRGRSSYYYFFPRFFVRAISQKLLIRFRSFFHRWCKSIIPRDLFLIVRIATSGSDFWPIVRFLCTSVLFSVLKNGAGHMCNFDRKGQRKDCHCAYYLLFAPNRKHKKTGSLTKITKKKSGKNWRIY